MSDRWYRTDEYFDPDVFDFNGHDVTNENVKAALVLRKLKPNSSKQRGSIKLALLVNQLKDFWISQKANTSSVSSAAGGSVGSTSRPIILRFLFCLFRFSKTFLAATKNRCILGLLLSYAFIAHRYRAVSKKVRPASL
jgi:hypothetical protein